MNNVIGKRIKEAMNLRGLKQVDIVKKTGINKGALSSYINGNYEPKQTSIYKIAEALNVSPAWMMGYDVPMNDKSVVVDKDLGRFKKGQILNNNEEIEEYSNLLEANVEKLKKKIEAAKDIVNEALPKIEGQLNQALISNEITVEKYNSEIKRFLELIKILDGMTQKEFDSFLKKYLK